MLIYMYSFNSANRYRSNLMKGFDTVDKYYNIQDYQKAHVARMKEQSDEEKPS